MALSTADLGQRMENDATASNAAQTDAQGNLNYTLHGVAGGETQLVKKADGSVWVKNPDGTLTMVSPAPTTNATKMDQANDAYLKTFPNLNSTNASIEAQQQAKAATLWSGMQHQYDPNAWQYQQGVSPLYQQKQNAVAGLSDWQNYTPQQRADAAQARSTQLGALQMLSPYATGQTSVARQQAELERAGLANRIASQVAGRPFDPAAMRGGQMALAKGSGDIAAQSTVAAAQERQAAINALQQGAAGLRAGDVSQLGQEAQQESALRAWQLQQDQAQQAWQKMGLGEKLAGMTSAQDYQKALAQQDQWSIAQGLASTGKQTGAGGTDYGSLAGGIMSSIGGLAMMFSDARTKQARIAEGVVHSGAQCKQLFGDANMPVQQFLAATGQGAPPPISGGGSLGGVPSGDGGGAVDLSGQLAKNLGGLAQTPQFQVGGNTSRSMAPGIQEYPAAQPLATSIAGQYGHQRIDKTRPWQGAPPPISGGGSLGGVSPGTGLASGPSPWVDYSPQMPGALSQGTAPWASVGGNWPGAPMGPANNAVAAQALAGPSPYVDLSGQLAGNPSGRAQTPQSQVGGGWPGAPMGPRDTAQAAQTLAQTNPWATGNQQAAPTNIAPSRLITSDEQAKDAESDGNWGLAAFFKAIGKRRPTVGGVTAGGAGSRGPAMGGGPEPFRASDAQLGLERQGIIPGSTPGVEAPAGPLAATPMAGAPGSAPALGSGYDLGGSIGPTGAAADYGDAGAGTAAAPSGGGAGLMGGVGQLGKGIGAMFKAAMPYQPAQWHPLSPVAPSTPIPSSLAGMGSSLFSDVAAKQHLSSEEYLMPATRASIPRLTQERMQPGPALDDFLEHMNATQFNYKAPYDRIYGPERRTGVIAQDVAASKLGAGMTMRDPSTGMLMLDTRPDKFNPLVLASLAHLNKRIDDIDR